MNVIETFIKCPHLEVTSGGEILVLTDEEKREKSSFFIGDGRVIPIHPKRQLLLCQQCWQVVRAAVYDDIVNLNAKHLRR